MRRTPQIPQTHPRQAGGNWGVRTPFDLVVPVLQRRGIYRTAYEERTLRENVGVPQPESRSGR